MRDAIRLSVFVALSGLATAQATNVALAGTATQSSTRPTGGAASRAIDGNTDGYFNNNSVTHTDPNATSISWWQVDLPQVETIHEIRIWNRSNCCTPPRLSNFKVTVLLGSAPMSTTTIPGAVPYGNYLSIDLGSGTVCDKVRIEHLGTTPQILSLAEVELLRYDQPVMNLARHGTATQSSTAWSGTADLAIDGGYNRVYNRASTSHTADPGTTPAWWEVQLAWTDRIDRINLFNRADCCTTRLSNFRVSIFLGPTELWGQDYFVTTGAVGPGMMFTMDPPKGTVGDRVRVALLGLNRDNNYVLSLTEVEVQRFGPSLIPDTVTIKDAAGSKQALALDAGRKFGGQPYILVGSMTGTAPGFALGGVTVPLNIDPYFLWTLENPALPPLKNSIGRLDPAGRGSAEFEIPNGAPSLLGLKAHHAYVVLGTVSILDAASNAASLEIVR